MVRRSEQFVRHAEGAWARHALRTLVLLVFALALPACPDPNQACGEGMTAVNGVCAATRAPDLCNALSISAGYSHTCAIVNPTELCAAANIPATTGIGPSHACTAGTEIRCWGANESGQLGTGDTNERLVPTTVALPAVVPGAMAVRGFLQVASGSSHTCALTIGGTVRCWGSNRDGLLGGASLESDVPGLSEVVQITAGEAHTCALRTDGHVRCWGTADRLSGSSTTTDIPGLSDVTQISARGKLTCALRSTRSVRCWGGDQAMSGVLIGTSATTDIPGLGNVVEIASGVAHACARTSEGRVRCWGNDISGSLGGSSRTRDISGLSGAVQVSAGTTHSCAVLLDGSVRCWGANAPNDEGQRGGGSTTQAVPGVSDVVQVTAGDLHTCARMRNGGVRCWGFNRSTYLSPAAAIIGFPPSPATPRLGDGTSTARTGPAAAAFCCAASMSVCTSRCVNLQTDVTHCGTCDRRCADGQRCVAGACVNNSLPTGLLAAGGSHTCTVRSIGSGTTATREVVCWGSNEGATPDSGGQLGVSDGDNSAGGRCVAVPSLGDVTQLVAGLNHSCALVSGAVKCWGSNGNGRLGNGTMIDSAAPVAAMGITNAVEIAAGDAHTCARLEDGVVQCWGNSTYGQLGNGSMTDSATPVTVMGLGNTTNPVVELSAGALHTCARLQNGEVRCWGGKLGNGSLTDSATPIVVTGLVVATNPVVELSAGGFHTCARLQNSEVRCWGNGSYGRLGNGSMTDSISAVAVTMLPGTTDPVVEIAAGGYHTCARLRTGGVQCWGYNEDGRLGNGSTTDSAAPVAVMGLPDATHAVAEIAAGRFHSCARLQNGEVRCWGNNRRGQLGVNTTSSTHPTPQPSVCIPGCASAPMTTTPTTCALTCVNTDTNAQHCGRCGNVCLDGKTCVGGMCVLVGCPMGLTACMPAACVNIETDMRHCGRCGNALPTGQMCIGGTAVTVSASLVSAGASHTCKIVAGAVRCWGTDVNGLLGDGDLITSEVCPAVSGIPARMPLEAAVEISAGWSHTCVRMVNNTLRCWGDNSSGQLGDGTTMPTSRTAPVTVMGLTNVAEVSAGLSHTCARKMDNTVWCWGSNSSGQLGLGTSGGNGRSPAQVMGITNAVEVVAGPTHTCVRTMDNTVQCWGANFLRQLGNGTSDFQRTLPTLVVGLPPLMGMATNAPVELALGFSHTCARLMNGQVWCWGTNGDGQLGDGTNMGRRAPVQVMGITNAVEIAAGQNHTCARLMDNTVRCWGANQSNNRGMIYGGRLGDGTTMNRNAPVAVMGLTNVAEITAGSEHTCARLANGDIHCWGQNRSRQLGEGTALEHLTPTLATCVVPTVAVTCMTGQTACGMPSACVDTMTSPAHCGRCDNACPMRANATATCMGGTCGMTCMAGFGDCDGMASNGCEVAIGGACTAGMGACSRMGTRECQRGGGTTCNATAGTPGTETCNGTDDDCDGTVDEMLTQACYTGPMGTAGIGRCQSGTRTCTMGSFGTTCQGEVLPAPTELCNGMDDNCNGTVDEGCSCAPGAMQSCYTGPTGTSGVGTCHAGSQTCIAGAWGTCTGATLPATETCDTLDNDCDGRVDDGFCRVGGMCYANGTANPASSCQTCVAPADMASPTTFTNTINGATCGSPAGGACMGGACSCPSGQMSCSGTCRTVGGPCTSAGAGGCAQTGTLACSGTGTACSATPLTTGTCSMPMGGLCGAGGLCACGGSAPNNCGGTCTSTLTDPANCGMCATRCPTGASCAGGVCGCPPGQIPCAGACVDVTSDTNHCGVCGTMCATGQVCSGGVCGPSCASGVTRCGTQCVRLGDDPTNCGMCGTRCGAGESCASGACVNVSMVDPIGCADGTREAFSDRTMFPNIAACGGSWATPGIFPAIVASTAPACATLGNSSTTAPADGAGCSAANLCGRGWHICNGGDLGPRTRGMGCAAESSYPASSFFVAAVSGPGCGRCALRTNTTTGPTCTATSCAPNCRENGDINNDLFGCGSLGTTAVVGPCDGLDRSSGDNCGSLTGTPWACGGATMESRTVTKTTSANGGVVCCRDSLVCPPGEVECSGACVNLSTDVAHCGTCTTACASGLICVSGVCSSAMSCSPGTPCRGSMGPCDPAEMCTSAGTCPADILESTSFVCRTGTGCDPSERCSGTSAACPADVTTCPSGQACVSGACTPTTGCSSGQHMVGTACVTDGGPRPLWPLSLGDVTQLRPTFRWVNPAGADGAVVELCRDRACTMILQTLRATGVTTTATGDLPASGVVFWRLRARVGSTDDTTNNSPVWLLHTPARSASSSVNSSASPHLDLNGDGYDDVAAGSTQASPGGRSQAGTATVRYGASTGVSSTTTVLEGASANDALGVSVASAGDVNGDGYGDLAVGSLASPGGRAQAGTLSIYLGSATGVTTTPQVVLEGAVANDTFGQKVSSAGDVNADGYADVLVAAPFASSFSGAATVFYGTRTGVTASGATALSNAGGYFGFSVSGAGDVNGDGFSDVVVGAYVATVGGLRRGEARVFHGGATGVSATAAVVLSRSLSATPAPAAGENFGISVAGGGDVNGDGYSDVIVGANAVSTTPESNPPPPTPPTPASEEGEIVVFHGGASGVNSTAAVSVIGTTLFARFGTAVSSAGDVNGDGYADVLVGSQGSARVFQGSGAGVVTTPYWVNLGASADRYGFTASGAGDIDRNGLCDVLVGAMFADPGGRTNAGTVSVYLFSGSPTPVTVTLEGAAANEILGRSVATRRVRSPFVCMCTRAEGGAPRRLASPSSG